MQFLGRVPDVKTYLGRADVIALSSISEAQPIALLEAAATGLPAVTTDVGSCREIIEGFADDPVQGRGGYVVAACNPKAMAEALAAILRDREHGRRDGPGHAAAHPEALPQGAHPAALRGAYADSRARTAAAVVQR